MKPDFKIWVQELFEPFGRVTVKRFFGGGGIYLGETMFALIGPGDGIYLKADAETQQAFLDEGCEEFVWRSPKGMVWESGYYTLPERLFDDGEELAVWAGRSFTIAQRAKAARPARKRTPRPKAGGTKAGRAKKT